MQPILIAAGGGGSSSRLGGMGHSMPPDGRGLINPRDNLNEWRKLVSKEDIDAGNLLYTEKHKYCVRRGRSQTALTRFCPLLAPYLPLLTFVLEFPYCFWGKICMPLTFPVTPTYFVLST